MSLNKAKFLSIAAILCCFAQADEIKQDSKDEVLDTKNATAIDFHKVAIKQLDEIEANELTKQPKWYKIGGYVGSFSKFGLNIGNPSSKAARGAYVDEANGIYPTSSFTSIVGKFNFSLDASNKFKIENADIKFNFDVTLGALANDSTIWDKTKDGKGASVGKFNLYNTAGLGYNYIGKWSGYDLSIPATGLHTHNIIVDTANIDIKSKYFDMIVGRYESFMDFFSGFTQGVNLDFKTPYGEGNQNEVKLWWFSSFGRAFAYSQWIYDFYSPKSLNGNHAVGLDISYGNMDNAGKDGKFLEGNSLMIRPFFYFIPDLYEAPGFKIINSYNTILSDTSFGSKTIIQALIPHIDKGGRFDKKGNPILRYGESVDEWSANINLIQTFFINNYNIGIGFYKNFGSANAHIGTYGNPLGLDLYTNTVYDIGPSINGITNKDAINGYIFGGATYKLGIGQFTWNLLGRLTSAPRASEQSAGFNISQTFNNGFRVAFKFEYYRVVTHQGYRVGYYGAKNPSFKENIADRSHIYFDIGYTF